MSIDSEELKVLLANISLMEQSLKELKEKITKLGAGISEEQKLRVARTILEEAKILSTENIPCDANTVEKLRVLTKRKYGKLKGVFNIEVTHAVNDHIKKLEVELNQE